jgi:hypothetical protein
MAAELVAIDAERPRVKPMFTIESAVFTYRCSGRLML